MNVADVLIKQSRNQSELRIYTKKTSLIILIFINIQKLNRLKRDLNASKKNLDSEQEAYTNNTSVIHNE